MIFIDDFIENINNFLKDFKRLYVIRNVFQILMIVNLIYVFKIVIKMYLDRDIIVFVFQERNQILIRDFVQVRNLNSDLF